MTSINFAASWQMPAIIHSIHLKAMVEERDTRIVMAAW
jgi:hypothetical protein